MPQRKSIRLKGYDYSQAGWYFITICTQNRKCLFGKIVNGVMILNDAGKMVKMIWGKIPEKHPFIKLHQYSIMPNHFHAIFEIVRAEMRVDMESTPTTAPTTPTSARNARYPTVGTIVQTFKRHTTIKYIEMVKQNILPPFNKRIWQRNYWEHIIRNEKAYNQLSEYTANNPLNWENDSLYMA